MVITASEFQHTCTIEKPCVTLPGECISLISNSGCEVFTSQYQRANAHVSEQQVQVSLTLPKKKPHVQCMCDILHLHVLNSYMYM